MKTSNPISQIAYKTEVVLFKVMHAQTVQKVLRYKGKATPVQAWTDPESFRRLRLPDFMTVNI
jgi:hypothetical protein